MAYMFQMTFVEASLRTTDQGLELANSILIFFDKIIPQASSRGTSMCRGTSVAEHCN